MFKIEADTEADAVYIQIKDAFAAFAEEVTNDIIVDYTEDGEVVGYDLQRFSHMTTADLQSVVSLRA